MQAKYDVALLGTGVAPLVAANRLAAQGKSVLILNPDWDFFREDSELSLDPLWPMGPENLNSRKLLMNRPESVLAELRPEFPGSIELWLPPVGNERSKAEFRDPHAPFVRGRSRIWMQSEDDQDGTWDALEAMYVEASDAGLNPQLIEGPQVPRLFPGFSGKALADMRAVSIPRICDIDVNRYRNGLLEFVRERLGQDNIVCGANEIQLEPGGIRYYSASDSQRGWNHAELAEGALVFWTPRMSSWIFSHLDVSPFVSATSIDGVQTWEEWTLVSKENLDASSIGVFDDLIIWADVQGPGSEGSDQLTVLRPGPRYPIRDANLSASGQSWASQESFLSLSNLARGFLKWDKFSIRSMRPRSVFLWENPGTHLLASNDTKVWVVQGCDGPIADVVRHSRNAVEIIE